MQTQIHIPNLYPICNMPRDRMKANRKIRLTGYSLIPRIMAGEQIKRGPVDQAFRNGATTTFLFKEADGISAFLAIGNEIAVCDSRMLYFHTLAFFKEKGADFCSAFAEI